MIPIKSFALSGCTITSSVVDAFKDQLGEHSIIKIVITQTGTTFSFTPADLDADHQQHWRGYAYWIGIVPTGTLDAVPELTVTDGYGPFTQFQNTTSFTVDSPVKVLGNSYDNQYLQLISNQTWSFNDVGTSEVITLYIDAVR